MVSYAHPSPQPKRYLDRFSCFCTTHGRVSKLPLPMGRCGRHLTHDSVSPSEPTNQTASRSVELFCTDDHRVSLYFTVGRTGSSPSKLPLPVGGPGPPSNTWFRGPTRVLNPNGISIGSAVFAGPPNMGSSIVFAR